LQTRNWSAVPTFSTTILLLASTRSSSDSSVSRKKPRQRSPGMEFGGKSATQAIALRRM
jgi:hypothetical protein